MNVALLHPGEMGVSVGAALAAGGVSVCWCPRGRSAQTHDRAAAVGLTAVDDFAELIAGADAVVSVCPPDQALPVARSVAQQSFDGLYVDANAVSPATASAVGGRFGSRYVDGGLIGPPAVQAGTTRLYLSGAKADAVAGWFSGSVLEAVAIGRDPGAASALKMCYAAYTKGLSALLLNVNALAAASGVTEALLAEWDRSQPGLAERAARSAQATARKAWRFEGEMREIARTFTDAGLPGDFHEAAAEIYRRMAPLKQDGGDLPAVIDVLLRR